MVVTYVSRSPQGGRPKIPGVTLGLKPNVSERTAEYFRTLAGQGGVSMNAEVAALMESAHLAADPSARCAGSLRSWVDAGTWRPNAACPVCGVQPSALAIRKDNRPTQTELRSDGWAGVVPVHVQR